MPSEVSSACLAKPMLARSRNETTYIIIRQGASRRVARPIAVRKSALAGLSSAWEVEAKCKHGLDSRYGGEQSPGAHQHRIRAQPVTNRNCAGLRAPWPSR